VRIFMACPAKHDQIFRRIKVSPSAVSDMMRLRLGNQQTMLATAIRPAGSESHGSPELWVCEILGVSAVAHFLRGSICVSFIPGAVSRFGLR
jgi:hypothetical protein